MTLEKIFFSLIRYTLFNEEIDEVDEGELLEDENESINVSLNEEMNEYFLT